MSGQNHRFLGTCVNWWYSERRAYRSDSQVPGGLPVNLAVIIVHGQAEAADLVHFISGGGGNYLYMT